VAAHDFGDFGVLPWAEAVRGAVGKLLEDFLGGEIPVAAEE
jgi:hypothetical protein